MNADGTMVTQLTSSLGTSDHDPTATNTVAVFERFTRDTNYSQDPWAVYSPWNIVEARIEPDGTVSKAHVLRSIPLLDQAAIDAVMQWRFVPTLLNGQAGSAGSRSTTLPDNISFISRAWGIPMPGS